LYSSGMRPIVLCTDFGLEDHYVGVLHAVLERDAPGASRIDLSHLVPPGDVWEASYLLRCAWSHLPPEAVVLAVVDPGVGGGRRALAAAVGERLLVAPDNGLAAAMGAVGAAVALDWQRMGLPEPSRTFHGRDLFSPAAARLARGERLEELGEPVSPASLVSCPLPAPERTAGGWRAVVLHVDRFGSLVTNLAARDLAPEARITAGSHHGVRVVGTFSDGGPGEVVALEGSSGLLELAVNGGSAQAATSLDRGDAVLVAGG
jgi:S-adenosyl-L-methionine hydrolase (adenosine-forming)